MCLVDMLCCMGVSITGLFCIKLHCSKNDDNCKVYPRIVDDMPRKATPYEMEIYCMHMNTYGKKARNGL